MTTRNPASTNSGAAEWQRWRWPAGTAWQLCLIGPAAVIDAIRETWVHLVTAKMEIGFARMAKRPLADTVIEVEQRRLADNLCAWFGGNQTTGGGRCRWGGLIAGALTQETTWAD